MGSVKNFISDVSNKIKFNNFVETLKKHNSEIYAGLGILGMTTAVVSGIANTPAAQEHIKKKKEELGKEKLTVWETVQAVAKDYALTATSYAFGLYCSIKSPKVSNQKLAAVSTALAIATSGDALENTKKAITEVMGEKGYEKIMEKVSDEDLVKPLTLIDPSIIQGKGSKLFYEPMTNQLFYAEDTDIVRAEARFNEMLYEGDNKDLDEWCNCLGINWNVIIGELVQFNIKQGKFRVHTEPYEYHGQLCWKLDYSYDPLRVPTYVM